MNPTQPPGTGARQIPLCRPSIGNREIEAVVEVLRSGWLAHGSYNQAFEERMAAYLGVPHCVSLNSCASALFLALLANGIRGEVILPSFTFVASANAVVNAGAHCVFVDVEYETGNLDPAAFEAAITPRTEAVMPVHFAGQAAEMARISAAAQRHGLLLVEDSAEAIGARQGATRTGGWGIGCFSFFPTKNITTGEGGMLTTRDPLLAEKARALSGHGIASTTLAREKKERPWLRAASCAGFNFRMSNLLAALGALQMERLDQLNESRRQRARQYDALLDRELFELPVERPGFHHVYQMYTVKLRKGDRTAFMRGMRLAGIGASVHFDPPVHLQPYYLDRHPPRTALPVTERLARSIVTLPIFPEMSDEEVGYVAQHANRLAREAVSGGW